MKIILDKIKSHKGTALIHNNKKISYGEIYKKYTEQKNFLKKNSISKKSIVAIQGEFDLDTITLMLAIIDIGAIYVPINFSIKSIDEYLKICEATHLLLPPYNKVNQINSEINHKELIKLCNSKDSGFILFSSGTTGEPKATLHKLSPMLKKYHEDGKRIISIAFLLYDHIGGFNTLMYSLSNGGILVTTKEKDVNSICKLIETHKVEVLPTTPSFLNLLLISKTYSIYDLSSLKLITYGTEPMLESTLKGIYNVLPNIKLKQTYGLSELGIMKTKSKNNLSLLMKIGDNAHKIKIINDTLFIKSDMAMICYLNAPSPFDEEGYFNTKDKVEIHGSFIKILGRESDIINVGGEKVYPTEIENIICDVKGVLNVLVKAEKNLILGNIIVAFINKENKHIDNKTLINNIKETCRKNLEKFKRPMRIIIENENLIGTRLKKKR